MAMGMTKDQLVRLEALICGIRDFWTLGEFLDLLKCRHKCLLAQNLSV